jgi:hypothetical protein
VWITAFNQLALLSTFVLITAGFLLGSVNQDNQTVSSFLVTFFLMWLAPSFAWVLGLAAIVEKRHFENPPQCTVDEHSLPLRTSFTALMLPLGGEVVAGIGMGYYMRGLWGLDGIGPPIAATGAITLFAVLLSLKRGARSASVCSLVAALLLNIGFVIGGRIS